MLPRILTILTAASLGLVVCALAFLLSLEVAQSPVFSRHLTPAGDREVPAETTATVTVVGDIMLAREVERAIMARGVDWPFSAIKDAWTDSDLVVGNFEATVRDAYRYEGEVLAFDVAPEYITGLAHAGFTHLSLANNHGDDFGNEVTEYTRETISDLGIVPFGDPASSALYVARAEPNGVPISLIGFHAFTEYPTSITDVIRTEHDQGRFVIVYPHWGNEYQLEPSSAQTSAAQLFVDAGADLIIGAHPHVIEPIGTVGGTPVAWSLGNFVFDQDWSSATREGLMLHVTINDNAVTLVPIPVTVTNRQPTVMTGTRVQEILDFIGVPDGSITFPR